MNRPAPRYRPQEIVAGVWLDPNGAHELEIAIPGNIVAMKFSRDQVNELKRAIAGFEETVTVVDGHGHEVYRGRMVPLEVKR
jgi:hypothetical protein